MAAFRYKNLTKICVYCQKEFHPTRPEYVCCSHKCSILQRRKERGQEPVQVQCAQCKKYFLTTPSRARNQKAFFCSTPCYWLNKKETSKGVNNPNYRHGGLKMTCPTCNTEFKTRDKKRKYCSTKCQKRINLKVRGTRFEWKARDELRKAGYLVVRSAGSLGAFDLIAINEKEIRLLQIKATNAATPLSGLYHSEMDELAKVTHPPNATIEFWCWRRRDGWEKVHLNSEAHWEQQVIT